MTPHFFPKLNAAPHLFSKLTIVVIVTMLTILSAPYGHSATRDTTWGRVKLLFDDRIAELISAIESKADIELVSIRTANRPGEGFWVEGQTSQAKLIYAWVSAENECLFVHESTKGRFLDIERLSTPLQWEPSPNSDTDPGIKQQVACNTLAAYAYAKCLQFFPAQPFKCALVAGATLAICLDPFGVVHLNQDVAESLAESRFHPNSRSDAGAEPPTH